MATTVDAAEVRQAIAERGQVYVSEATGFDAGVEFTTEAQVRGYFTVANVGAMLGECPYTQEGLDLMAQAVIDGGWHMDGEPCPTCRSGQGGRQAPRWDETLQAWAVYRGGWVRCPSCGGSGLAR